MLSQEGGSRSKVSHWSYVGSVCVTSPPSKLFDRFTGIPAAAAEVAAPIRKLWVLYLSGGGGGGAQYA